MRGENAVFWLIPRRQVKLSTTILTYFGYALLVAFGYMRDFFSK